MKRGQFNVKVRMVFDLVRNSLFDIPSSKEVFKGREIEKWID